MLRRAVLVVFATLIARGSGATAVRSQAGKVAMLLPGSVNDQSWNAAGYAGLLKLKEKGLEIAYSERPGRERSQH